MCVCKGECGGEVWREAWELELLNLLVRLCALVGRRVSIGNLDVVRVFLIVGCTSTTTQWKEENFF